MSEEYRTHLEYLVGMVERLDEGRSIRPVEEAKLIALISLVERLERLVAVLEQIRDRLPGQIAK